MNITDPIFVDGGSPDAFDNLDDNVTVSEQVQISADPDSEVLLPEQIQVILPSTHMPNSHNRRKAKLALRIKQASQYLTTIWDAIVRNHFNTHT